MGRFRAYRSGDEEVTIVADGVFGSRISFPYDTLLELEESILTDPEVEGMPIEISMDGNPTTMRIPYQEFCAIVAGLRPN